MTGEQESRSLLGRRVIIVLPVVLFAMALMVLLMLSSTSYHFKVTGGQLGLWASKLGWVDAQPSKAMGFITVGNADFGELMNKTFESEIQAINALSTLVATRIADRQQKVAPLEKQLAGLYTDLLAYLKVAGQLGLPGEGSNVEGLQGWLDRYYAMVEKASRAKRVTGSETFPFEMLRRSPDTAPAKSGEALKTQAHGAAPAHQVQAPAGHEQHQ